MVRTDSTKLVSPRSSTDEIVGGPVKNMGGPIKLLYITMFKIGKSCKKLIDGLVKHEKFSQCLGEIWDGRLYWVQSVICVLLLTSWMQYRVILDCYYRQVPLKHGPINDHITYGTVITVAGSESDFRITADTPNLTLTGELWGVFCEYIFIKFTML